ncbi:MAG: SRPBCC family protein [Promethearchaeota archaeon]
MPEIETKIEIKAPPNVIFKILDDFKNAQVWNIVITHTEELEPNKKYFFKTNVGDMTTTRTETIENRKVAMLQEGSPIQEMAYLIEPKGEMTEVTIWGIFELEEQRSIMKMAGELLLKSLKVYVNYIVAGGKPEEYTKSFDEIKKV